ncbi:C40 family peptidase [Nocardiopsis sp. CT-R113]|uniref:C40 family peptidase n=1 Tax=Nocardiopsis codii TaxID=3065942 RepID=A0ABU7KB79_9ACTN|nr:C40 family peptidase [Nocardiopsis sp. CT-R113]MEE2039486.1 C40 family peptidase [Nocardiopsis sp. CT-R113]
MSSPNDVLLTVRDGLRRVRDRLLSEPGRAGDSGSATARVGGGATALAVMGGIAYAATMCGPDSGVTASGFNSSPSSSGIVQASASSSSSGTTITISSHGESGASGEKTVRVDIPEDILRMHRTAAETYDIPWEVVAAVGAIETQNGQYGPGTSSWPSGLTSGERNPYGAAGIVQFGVLEPLRGRGDDRSPGARMGAAANAWGGEPLQAVSERPAYRLGDPNPGRGPDSKHPGTLVPYFGVDGNNDGQVNVWDPHDNITSGAFRLAYYAEKARKEGTGSACPSRPNVSPLECTLYIHNNASWYVAQVMDVIEYYNNSDIAPTSPPANIQTASMVSDGAKDCEEQGGNATRAAFLGNASEEHRTVVEFARSKIGMPYIWGGTGPSGYDCSGLLLAAWNSMGVTVPRVTDSQWNLGEPGPGYGNGTAQTVLDQAQGDALDVSVLQPGDFVFFHYPGGSPFPSHVGMYSGGGQMIHAPAPGKHIIEVSIESSHYQTVFVGAVRITPDSSGGGGTAQV